jgi:type III pantothenate kinase
MSKSIFICQSCGAVYKKWSGQCKECGEWNTITEEVKEGGFISPNTNITQTIISSVNQSKEQHIAQTINKLGISSHILSHQSPLPFIIDYTTPQTLGKDRIAALAGAYAINGSGNYLIIDCGTCNTYDLLINNHFIGGNIAPGLQMRLDAMHHFTSALPQCNINDKHNTNTPLGKTTKNAIWNGAFWGIIYEIKSYIDLYTKKYSNLNIILTGGLFTLVENIQPIIKYFYDNNKNNRINKTKKSNITLFHEPQLVPIGLNFIAKNLSK